MYYSGHVRDVYKRQPVDGLVIVTSPQELVAMIVEKAVKMADMMKMPVVGIVENMSYCLLYTSISNIQEEHMHI